MKFPKKPFIIISLLVLIVCASFSQEKDVEGSRDYPLLPRMRNFYISDYKHSAYESHEFYDAQDNEYAITGEKWIIDYTLRERFADPGQLKVRKNYIDAIKKIGGTILFDEGLYMKVVKGGKEIWIEVWVSDYGNDYTLTIVERTALRQKVTTGPNLARVPVRKKNVAKNPDLQRIEQSLARIKRNKTKTVVNLRTVVKRVQNAFAAAFPYDICKTPSPGGPVPIPYPNIGKSSDTAKGAKKVKINADKAVALKNASNYKKSESDEAGTQAATLTEAIQKRLRKGPVAEKDKVIWKNKLYMYQDQAAAIVKAMEKYVEEVEKLLEESKKELGLGIK
jgi:hypothetical protein